MNVVNLFNNVFAVEYLEHMGKQSCMAIQNDAIHYPLCKIIVEPATEQGWKSHLITECTKNRRNSRFILIAFGSYLNFSVRYNTFQI
ncbi:3428_t:CDS:2 [Rhizophagus irregularis]|nr:3428_t:CDS:2 [Rhizophagus irregularis]